MYGCISLAKNSNSRPNQKISHPRPAVCRIKCAHGFADVIVVFLLSAASIIV